MKWVLSIIGVLLLALLGVYTYFQISVSEKLAANDYQEYCMGCHGANFEKFLEAPLKNGTSVPHLYNSITNGYPKEGMPSFENTLSKMARERLALYIINQLENAAEREFYSDKKDFTGVIKTEKLDFRLDTIVSFDSLIGKDKVVPWGISFVDTGDMLVTLRSGKLWRVNDQGVTEVTGVPEVHAKVHGGLLDVEVMKNGNDLPWIYLSYAVDKEDGNTTTALMRAKLDGNKLVDKELLFEALPMIKSDHEYGSRIVFDAEGYLYLTVGHRGVRPIETPILLDNDLGKVHRFNADGSIPADNPYVNTEGAHASIYTYGHRNQQGLTFDEQRNVLWATEHGPKGGDEVNKIVKGGNYGWPEVTHGVWYNGGLITDVVEREDVVSPTKYWVPSIAPGGMDVVHGGRYPEWEGDLLVGSLKFQHLIRLEMEGETVVHEEQMLKTIGRLRDVEIGPDGYIYIAVEGEGHVFRLMPVSVEQKLSN